jgi:hypothetical protein
MARATTGLVLPRRPPRHATRHWARVGPPPPAPEVLRAARAQARRLALARWLLRR